ncbi:MULTISPECIES: GntR family transcriptional regulator [unclassified Aureimonas]|uniref:GntR family transcriptional regulator n=1 Tax=unclassified Aureimonas TaxID=2615206 RepID=UPI0006F94875|nr:MULTISPECIES: GntR family transcriptional regulator [unclassified Aureimonas]KQT69051.1 GntR family transcriptional regulator [Aureimonas sp. Leaf460]KQT69287.1 GntR family transcriptional regulator [Aureimonas sp. Leaf427]
MQDGDVHDKSADSIDQTILGSILAHRIRPGARLGEGELATLFGVSRTLVREAMMRLETRGIVEVRPRRGWFVVEPSAEEAGRVFQARRAVEAGAIRLLPRLGAGALGHLHAHLAEERQALAVGDHPRLVCLMGDFHIRIVEILDNPVLTSIVRDLTARTILIAMLYQSDDHAEESHLGHCRIVEALERGDLAAAADLAVLHIDEVEAGLDLDLAADPLAALRLSLAMSADLPSPAPGKSRPSNAA